MVQQGDRYVSVGPHGLPVTDWESQIPLLVFGEAGGPIRGTSKVRGSCPDLPAHAEAMWCVTWSGHLTLTTAGSLFTPRLVAVHPALPALHVLTLLSISLPLSSSLTCLC